ncbi:MAG TPA: flagellar basal body L-ring protein FlgH [Bryobacteraceae bacterium]|nr:flagellar basal body L-ring protein FlgH [Bryobacteraceae bacterium]
MTTGYKAILTGAALVAAAVLAPSASKKPAQPNSALERYLLEAEGQTSGTAGAAAPGSVWSASGRLSDMARDLRASQQDDLVTILVVERASAVAKGSTKSARASSASNSIGALGGLTRAAGPLANLARLSGDSQLSGEGSTSRETVLSTTLSARVTQVLPNGALVVEGTKTVQVNAEQQVVTVRGVVRPTDLTPGNVVQSDRVAYLEVRINGKGVVGDAVRRPFFLYRLLLGLLPF